MEDPRLGKFQLKVFLAVRDLGGDAYGVSVRREIGRLTGKEPSLGAIYTTLWGLERRSFVFSKLDDATRQRGGSEKCLYRISQLGEVALERASECPS